MSEMKKCPRCHAQNPVIANFCRKCCYDFRGVSLPNDTPVKKSWLRYLGMFVSVCLIIEAMVFNGILVFRGISSKPMEDTEVTENYIPTSFNGNYSVCLESNGKSHFYTASVVQYTSSNYRIDLRTDYGKSIYTFTVQADGTLSSPELGKGKVTYKEPLNKLSLEFFRESNRCVLTKIF